MRSPGVIAAILAVAALVAGCTDVPDVVGQSHEQAAATIGAAWLRADTSAPPIESMQAIDAVVSQDPAPGERALWRSRVAIVRSGGTTIGDYAGRDAAEARAELEARGLNVTLNDVEADGIAKGIVAGQTPTAGAPFSAPDGITLSVAVGPWIEVPALIDLPGDAAKEQLSTLKLAHEVEGPDESGMIHLECSPSGDFCPTCQIRPIVRATEPAAGTLLFPNATVRLVTEEERYDCIEPLRSCQGVPGCQYIP